MCVYVFPLGALLGLSWDPLGALGGHRGAILEAPGAVLGPVEALLGASLKETLVCFQCLKDLGPPGASLEGRPLGHLKPSWGGLGASWRHDVYKIY